MPSQTIGFDTLFMSAYPQTGHDCCALELTAAVIACMLGVGGSASCHSMEGAQGTQLVTGDLCIVNSW